MGIHFFIFISLFFIFLYFYYYFYSLMSDFLNPKFISENIKTLLKRANKNQKKILGIVLILLGLKTTLDNTIFKKNRNGNGSNGNEKQLSKNGRKKRKRGIDKEFIKQMKQVLKIIIPGVKSKEFGILL